MPACMRRSMGEGDKLEAIIRTEKLSHTYSVGTPFEHRAIIDLDFSAFPGEFIGLIGHTGSGKSTLIQHLNGLLAPTAGRVLFEGEDIHETKEKTLAVRFQVGLVFQYPEYQLFEETVYKDIAFGPNNMGLSEGEIDQRVREAAALVGLAERDLEKSPFELSGGQKRRAAIAGVMAMKPRVLILDEPTAGLDPQGRREIGRNIQAFHKETGATVILVTHSMEEIARTVERIVVMQAGRIAMEGNPRKIFTSQGEALEKMGLDVPEITRLILRLRAMGLGVPADLFTAEETARALLEEKARRQDA